jgi:hypothetical protein
MKIDLQNLLNQVNSISVYNPEIFQHYKGLVKQCAEKLQTINTEDHSPMFSAWVNMGLEEIKKELSGRLNDSFISLSPDKQKSEFMYSRSTVTMALTNIIMNI